MEVIYNHMLPLLIHHSTVLSSVQKFPPRSTCEWVGQLPRCVFGSWMSETGVCAQCARSTVQAVFSGEQRSAILCISLTSLALNGARTREQRPGGPSMMDGTAESSDGEGNPTWVSSKEMFLLVCLCSLPSPFQPSACILAP